MAAMRTPSRRAMLALAAAILLAPAVTGPATAVAPTWTVTPVAQPTGPSGQFAAVACTPSDECVAVGTYRADTGLLAPVAETRAGTRWVRSQVDRFPTVDAGFAGASCASATFCVAVGTQGSHTLAEHWDGTRWRAVSTPDDPGSPISALTSVSCASTAQCVAVGRTEQDTTIGTLTLVWDGAVWTRVPAVDAGAVQTVLQSVSCPALSSCTAVGYSVSARQRNTTLVESWDGSGWTVLATPNPYHHQQLDAVSCTAVAVCTAVGASWSAHIFDRTAFILRREGATWTEQAAVPVQFAGWTEFTSVSCTTATACWAAGAWARDPAEGDLPPLFQSWDGTAWTKQPVPASAGKRVVVAGVACAGSGCHAVGYTERPYYSPLTPTIFAARWTGTAWTSEPTAIVAGMNGNWLADVSCASVSGCLAVGGFEYGDLDMRPRATAWDGVSWTEQPPYVPDGGSNPELDAVSCALPTNCTAVGADGTHGYAARWAGGALTYSTPVVPVGATSLRLSDVSCAPATRCTAVGSAQTPDGLKPVAERWNGHAWVVQPLPAAGSSAGLSGVSCASVTSCVAVGGQFADGHFGVLIDRWDGASWSTEVPAVVSGQAPDLAAVSCPTAGYCVAAGSYYKGGLTSTLVEVSDASTGGGWSVQPTPNPSTFDTFFDVSCATPSACLAVGPGGGPQPFAEHWNGTKWSVENPAIPDRALHTVLYGVSCPSAHLCLVAGSYDLNPWYLTMAVAERFQF